MIKYFNKKNYLVHKGKTIALDSIGERKRFMFLAKKEEEGLIENLEAQRPFILFDPREGFTSRIGVYKADFVYEKDGQTCVEDYKSSATVTTSFKMKKVLFELCYHTKINLVFDHEQW